MDKLPSSEHFQSALDHVNKHLSLGEMTAGAAKGILYSLSEVLGTVIGDPNLPEHIKSGYQGVLEIVREVQLKL